ncbi:MAG: hypothetical protein M3N53_06355 [Actinomycetota bacterium]|nr:hypothetical protein [Actinomycetota bacterium]
MAASLVHRRAWFERLFHMNLLFRGLLASAVMVAAGCDAPVANPAEPAPSAVRAAGHPPGPAERLGVGGYTVTLNGTRSGEPFDIVVLTTDIEVKNNLEDEVVPVCVLTFGSQTALIDTNGSSLEPGERTRLSGQSAFPRPLDDYESGDAFCYDRLPQEIERELVRERRLLEMGRRTRVPDLVGRPLDALLPSFRRGLDVAIASEETPCSKTELMEIAYSYPAFERRCRAPVVVAQDAEPGLGAEVGDVIAITVGTMR